MSKTNDKASPIDGLVMEYLEEGFYYLYNPEEKEPVLVHGYRCTDMEGVFVFGFNTHDGGGLLPLSDLSEGSTVVKVNITPVISA